MEILAKHKNIKIYNEELSNVKYLHILLNNSTKDYNAHYTNSVSEFELKQDGYHIVYSYKLNIDEEVNINELLQSDRIRESKNILVVCFIEECLNRLNKQILDKITCSNICNSSELTKLTSERDIVFISFSTIKYLGELGLFIQADEMLNKFHNLTCNCPCTPCWNLRN